MKRHLLLRTISWLLALTVLFLYHRLYSFDERNDTAAALSGIDGAVLYAAARLINRLLIPKLLHRRKYLLFALSVLVLTAAGIAAIQLLQGAFYAAATSIPEAAWAALRMFSFQVFNSWLLVILGLLCIMAYRLLGDHLAAEGRYQELLREQAQTELKFLKAQINPHFLFNSINSIYAHIDKSNLIARDIVLRFSQMLRYQLYDCNAERIAIEKELAYLQDYVALQRLRKEESLQVSLTVEGPVRDFDIAPLLLIPFVENAFKYASTHDSRPNSLRITLSREGGLLRFCCYNTRDSLVSRSLPQDSGIGIANVRRRLELSYPSAHRLEIDDKEAYFEVRLQLRLV